VRGKGTKTVKQIMVAHWKATGRKPKPLAEQGECPEGFDRLWAWFTRLSWRRGRGFGPMPITYADLDAFQRNEGIVLTPWQLHTLEHLDAIWMSEHA
jgi:hypothetical protein